MQIVIDSNQMQTKLLRDVLSFSPENKAVITDYSAIEAFQGNTLTSIDAAWTVLKDFPDQILVLKGNRAASLVNPSATRIQHELIDKDQTAKIRGFIHVLECARSGNKNIQNQLLQRGKIADELIAGVLKNSDNIGEDISEFSQCFCVEELRRMRRKEPWKQETSEKFFEIVIYLTKQSFDTHPDNPEWPRDESLVNHFLFRYNLAYCLYLMLLVSKGTQNRKASCVKNDLIDVNFATYATYFNGLMSDDHLALSIYDRTRFLLIHQNAFLPELYQCA